MRELIVPCLLVPGIMAGWFIGFITIITLISPSKTEDSISPDGRPAVIISAWTYTQSLQLAANKCPNGYVILDQQERVMLIRCEN